MQGWTISIAAAAMSLFGSSAAAAQADAAVPALRVDTNQVASACLSPAEHRRPASGFTIAQRRRIVACMTAAAVRQLNAQLPRQIDEITILDRASAAGTELTYHYTIRRQSAELPADVAERLESGTRAYVCAQQPMVTTMRLGGLYTYRWVDSDGYEIHRVTITRC